MSRKKNYIDAFMGFIASKRFFYIVIGLFLFQTTWIGLSNNYGSPHDEKYHVGLIQAYSQHVSPFISNQPMAYDQFGDLSRSTSYLYHYLMSLPYRLISALSSDLTTQVIFLRVFNILFVVVGLFIFKKVLDSLFNKSIVSNLALFGVVMIPVFTYVAAGVNYDNLVFLGFAASLYMTLKLLERFNLKIMIAWLIINTLTILVKFSYAPLAIILVVGTFIYYAVTKKDRIIEIRESFNNTKRITIVLMVLPLIIVVGLLAERYVGNLVTYGTPLPDCAKVLNTERCSNWGPWQRNLLVQQKNKKKVRVNVISYASTWAQTMESSSFGIYKSAITKQALPILGAAGWVLAAMFLLFMVLGGKYIIKRPALLIAICTVLFYGVILFIMNYKDYRALGAPVAIQGRYLIPVMPLLMGVTLFFAHKFLATKEDIWRAVVITFIIVFLQGGVVTYIIRSDQAWWWHNNTVVTVNETAQKILKPITIGD